MSTIDDKVIRKFDTGATRDTANNKLDFEGFLSPTVLDLFVEYMNKNRVQSDGSIRDSDNWQKGIPMPVYVKSGWRHFFHWWKLHRGLECRDEKGNLVTMRDAIGGLLFNVMGYAHEWLKVQEAANQKIQAATESAEAKPFPRFFHQPKNERGPESIFVFVAENIGRTFPIGGYGWCGGNWSLSELTVENWGTHCPPPMEISAFEAVIKGLPNRLADWPVSLLEVIPEHILFSTLVLGVSGDSICERQ